jgi:integrin alpha FG-GAP repeat containing protein 1
VFLDIDEDGRLDILVQRNTSSGHSELLCIYNNFVKDTFFIKALMINTPSKYGDAAVGSSYRLIVTDLNDNKFVVIGSQLAQ